MSPTTTKSTPAAMTSASASVDAVAAKSDVAIETTRRMTNDALDSLQDGVDTLRQGAPAALSRAAAQVEELTRTGIARAREAGTQARQQAQMVGEKGIGYVRDEPVKSVLIAAATGAAVAALVGYLFRSKTPAA